MKVGNSQSEFPKWVEQFLSSRRKPQYSKIILEYLLKTDNEWVELAKMEKDLVIAQEIQYPTKIERKIPHENTFYRVLVNLEKAQIIRRKEEVIKNRRSRLGKEKTNTYYRLTRFAIVDHQEVSKEYMRLLLENLELRKELFCANYHLRKYGITIDPDACEPRKINPEVKKDLKPLFPE